MKKFLCVFVVTMLLLSVSGCATVPDEQDTAVLPPSRVGGSQMRATLVKNTRLNLRFQMLMLLPGSKLEIGLARTLIILQHTSKQKCCSALKAHLPKPSRFLKTVLLPVQ